jgi:hypothetical protein
MTTKIYDLTGSYLSDTAAASVYYPRPELGAIESHVMVLTERLAELSRAGARPLALAEIKLQKARGLANLDRGAEAWRLAREAFDTFIEEQEFESAAEACEVLFQAEQPQSIAALGQGIWLAVTYPIDPELAIELLSHVIDETPDESDGAAVAATTALFLADIRASGRTRENLMFFATQGLAQVAHRHSGVVTQEELNDWMERLELREPDKFLVRLRNVVDVLVQDDWWIDREALLDRLPPEASYGPAGASPSSEIAD